MFFYVWLKRLVTYGHTQKELMIEDLKCVQQKILKHYYALSKPALGIIF